MSVKGSEEQWILAFFLDPFSWVFWYKNYKEQTGETDREDQKRDEEYYRQRKN